MNKHTAESGYVITGVSNPGFDKLTNAQIQPETFGGICAWCKHVYDANGKPMRQLSPEEYARMKSHGICKPCRKTIAAQETARYSPTE